MRRRSPWSLLALLFVVVPVVEIYVLIQIGQVIGAWWTVLLLVADGVLGSWLVRREGRRAWRALTEALGSGRMPARELADGALVLVGGTLLLTPGFVTDVAALFCILPFTRPVARSLLTRLMARRLVTVMGAPPPGTFPAGGTPGSWPPGSWPPGAWPPGSPRPGPRSTAGGPRPGRAPGGAPGGTPGGASGSASGRAPGASHRSGAGDVVPGQVVEPPEGEERHRP